jgi:hypothetical protein
MFGILDPHSDASCSGQAGLFWQVKALMMMILKLIRMTWTLIPCLGGPHLRPSCLIHFPQLPLADPWTYAF